MGRKNPNSQIDEKSDLEGETFCQCGAKKRRVFGFARGRGMEVLQKSCFATAICTKLL